MTQPADAPARGTTNPDRMLYGMGEAAQKLDVSIKLLRGHVEAGDIRYILVGKRTRKFTQEDLDEFIERRRRCSTGAKAPHSGGTGSSAAVESFAAALKRLRKGKPRR